MGKQIKCLLLINTLLQQVYSYFSSHVPIIQLFISTWAKSYEGMFPTHVSVIKGNILITIIKFARYHLFLLPKALS